MSHLHADRRNIILEVGTNYGTSTIVMAQALIDSKRPGKIIAIEKDYATAEIAKEHFVEAGVKDYIRLLVGPSRDMIPRIDTRIDIAFIDGSHDCPDVMDDFDNVLQLLNPGGLVIFDNTTMGGVCDALKIIKAKYGGNFVEFPCVSWSPAGMLFWKR
jgi:caffeoyl-CoA O-methyltransferase